MARESREQRRRLDEEVERLRVLPGDSQPRATQDNKPMNDMDFFSRAGIGQA